MNCDVAIVGAGPGGLFLAKSLSEDGICPVVLEMLKDVYAVCGELTNKHTLDLLGISTNSEIVSNTIRRTEVILLDKNFRPKVTMEIPGKVTGDSYLLNSDLLKKYLKECAESNGTAFKFNSRVTDVIKPNGRIEGVRTVNEEYKSNVTVGADGSNSVIAEKAGIDLTNRKGSPTMKVKLKNCTINDTECARFLLREDFNLGYMWDYPRSKTEANIGIGSFRPEKMSASMKSTILSYIKNKKEFAGANIWYEKGDIVPCSGLPPRVSGNGWVVIGDAAGEVSNIVGGGVSTTLYGAKMASDAIKEAFKMQDFSEKTLGKYEKNYRNSDVGKSVQSTAKILKTIIQFSEKRNIYNYIDEALKKVSPEIITEFVGGGFSMSMLPKLLPAAPLVLRIVKDYSMFRLEYLLKRN